MGRSPVEGPPPHPRPRLCLFTRAWRAAGTGLYTSELARGMAEAGIDVTFVAPRSSDPRQERPVAGLRRMRPPHEIPGAGRAANALRSVARMVLGGVFLARARLSNRLFVVSIMDPLPVALAMLVLLRLSGAKIIFIAHDPVPHAWHLPPRLRALEQGAWRLCHRLADALVVLSEPSRRTLARDMPGLRSPVAVIDHGIFGADHPAPLPGSGTILLFGTLRSNKGVLEAMEGAALAHARAERPFRLVIRGGGHRDEGAYLDAVRHAAARAGEAVDLKVGFVGEEEVPRLLAGCDALLMPYRDFHSQSGVAMLAAGHARPIIASPAGGLASLIEDGMPGTWIGEEVTGESVCAAILAFLDEPAAVWNERVAAYHAHVLERYSWRAIG
ncbi:MAG: glycosyltransferase family 4 protein, partial [Sphingobium sp.]